MVLGRRRANLRKARGDLSCSLSPGLISRSKERCPRGLSEAASPLRRKSLAADKAPWFPPGSEVQGWASVVCTHTYTHTHTHTLSYTDTRSRRHTQRSHSPSTLPPPHARSPTLPSPRGTVTSGAGRPRPSSVLLSGPPAGFGTGC